MNDRGAMVRVELRQVPVELWSRASAHQEALRREFDILMADLPRDSVPHRLADLLAGFAERFGGLAEAQQDELRAAADEGREKVDITFSLPPDAGAAASDLKEMLASVDEFCRAGADLLTLATPPELVAFRHWFLGEFSRQIDQGLPPRSWDEFEREVPATPLPGSLSKQSVDGAAAEPILFEGDLDLASAGALRDKILSARASGAGKLVIDLTRVGFMDSVGLSLLVSAHNRMTEEGVPLRVLLPAHLRRLFEISGLIDTLRPEFAGQERITPPTAVDEGR